MEIRKTFKFEMGHIVRNAWSRRCSKNAHGHSYTCEVFFEGRDLDNGMMLIDFGLIKQYLHDLIDSFDHSFWLWDIPEDKHIVDFFTKEFERVIVTPWSSSAEAQAMMFYYMAEATLQYLKYNEFNNGESLEVYVSRVIVHETLTGKAEFSHKDALEQDNSNRSKIELNKVFFTDGIKAEWKNRAQVEEILKSL